MTTIIRSPFLFGALLALLVAAAWAGAGAQSPKPAGKQAIAHRGASGYAPEHTAAAYTLAIQQKVDFVEQDLGVTRDNQLICIHDDTLERTTNIAEVFPDRSSPNVESRTPGKHWLVNDFTLAEIRRLDAAGTSRSSPAASPDVSGSHRSVRGHGGIYPELKSPPLYTARGVDMEKIFVSVVKKLGLDTPASMKTMPVIIQSFDEATIRRVATDLPAIPRVFLTSRDEDVTDARLKELSKFSNGIAPEKIVIARHPEMVARALGLTVTSWTFSANEQTAAERARQMAQFLYTWGIDALFTNNPDQFHARPSSTLRL